MMAQGLVAQKQTREEASMPSRGKESPFTEMAIDHVQSQNLQKKDKIAALRSALLTPLQLGDANAAREVLQRRAKLSRRWQADHSHFSTLSLDVCIQKERSSTLTSSAVEGFTLDGKARQQQLNRKAFEEASMTSISTISEAPSGQASSFSEARAMLLGFRAVASKEPMPAELMTCRLLEDVDLRADERPAGQGFFGRRQQSEPSPTSAKAHKEFARQMSAFSPTQLPNRSANAYRPGMKQSDGNDIKRQVQALLNKICPENVAQIVSKIAAIEVETLTDLEAIIELMFKKAVSEPHYCETYADLVFSLKAVYPSFPCPDGGKPATVKGLVLNICQNEFEELLSSCDVPDAEKEGADPEELEYLRKKRKDRMRANMKFIGHLFLRQLLSAKVIGTVICELVLCEQTVEVPEEHALECVCELLLAIGYTLESMPAGRMALASVCARLKELKSRQDGQGKSVYCKRVQFMIQDVLDTRMAGWQKKVFQAQAKTKEEIRLGQERELLEKAQGKGECVVTGQRPAYLSCAIGA
eukprot:TRINITY_DN4221_c1_g4_i1.p1 TRINITY_DN4221_c1_g4~~TRINITY_DN4221_c1_g4_i1.p1  ORF type:complete len:529 (+),score=135.23 TRINITY_DN4221_c1_g4_i1:80-1666(+)